MARPREFDEDLALDRAMKVFWRQGYEGTSLSDLTEAMSINRPSLYAAFGSKEQLFQRVLQRYRAVPSAQVSAALELPTARATVEELLRFYAETPAMPGRPRGCILLNGGFGGSAENEPIREELRGRRVGRIAELRRRFEQAQKAGELPAGVDAAALARYYWAVMWGIAIQAVDGATRAELRRLAGLALAAWPVTRDRSTARSKPRR